MHPAFAKALRAGHGSWSAIRDPGVFAHGGKYIIERVYDSTEDLSAKVKVDMASLSLDDAGHFAGNTETFRHWDAEGEIPAGCARCHSAGGLPQFIHNGGTMALAGSSLLTTGCIPRRRPTRAATDAVS